MYTPTNTHTNQSHTQQRLTHTRIIWTLNLITWNMCSTQLRRKGQKSARCVSDKLAVIREVWEERVERLLYLYNPRPEVKVEEQLVPFRGKFIFSSVQWKWLALLVLLVIAVISVIYVCDTDSNLFCQKVAVLFGSICPARYGWSVTHNWVSTGKQTSGGPEKNQGMLQME